MSIETNLTIRPNYLYLHCKGTYTVEEAKRLFDFAIQQAISFKNPRVLIDAREVVGQPTTFELYELGVFLGERLTDQGRGKVQGIAIVGEEPLIDPKRFGETVARNRGVNLRVVTMFEILDEAINWLLRT